MIECEQIFKHLDFMGQLVPTPFYWMDLNGRFIGINDYTLEGIGAPNKEFVLGKTVYQVYEDKDIADKLQEDIDRVIRTGEISYIEDKIIDVTTRKIKYYTATRAPLYDYNNNIIGIIGASIEITAQKEAEQLKIENELNRKTLEEQARFGRVVRQMAHDLVSPMSTLTDVVKNLGSNIPEDIRVNTRNAVERIAGIAQRLISKYDSDADTSDIISVPLALLQIMTEKREEYRESGVKFDIDIDVNANFEFIKIDSSMFKRMISNLVNNAVDALNNVAEAKVSVEFMSNAGKVLIVISDNGHGMPQHIQEKVRAGVEVTEGKQNGHGIGLMQVIDTINAGGGDYQIHANEDFGTQIYIWFPSIPTPQWLAKEIKLTKDDTIIILDDDVSIHGTWDNRLKSVLIKHPTLNVKHFHQGKEVVRYINGLTQEEKQNVFLLTDYELLEQGINGLDVVAQTEILRAILVTSYATHKDVQYKVIEAGIKMLPKELASAAAIVVDKKIPKWSSSADMVWVEDKKHLVDKLVKRYYNHLTVDVYYDPISFLEDVHQYHLDTRIILDAYYLGADEVPYILDGFDLAHKLHNMGYTKLILFTGETPQFKVPEYLQVVLKSESVIKHQQLDEI